MKKQQWFGVISILVLTGVMILFGPRLLAQVTAGVDDPYILVTVTPNNPPDVVSDAPTPTEPLPDEMLPSPSPQIEAAEPTLTPTGEVLEGSSRIAPHGLYVVQSGDTLWDIAVDFGVSVDALVVANPSINPDLLQPDDVLTIPGYADAGGDGTAEPGEISLDSPITAYVSAEGGRLLLRDEPSSMGPVLALLSESAPLQLIGQTADGEWLEVVAVPSNLSGWVMALWVDELVDLAQLPVTGESVEVTPTPRPTFVAEAVPTQEASSAFATATPAVPPPETYAVSYPYLTGITDHAFEIFERGRLFGNRPDIFSKVGDSITANEAFLFPVGMNGYNLHDYDNLQPVVDYYLFRLARDHNSFANTSLAAKGGWLTWHVLISRYADAEACYPGETPLECEYRAVRPAVALIMLGTNDVLSTQTGIYEEGIRRVIETSEEMGVIPVMSTIPPFFYGDVEPGRVEELNSVVRALAAEYEVPLWDYWAAVQSLPNYGLAADGVHPSWARPADFTPENLEYGMAVRNLTALQALDAVWRNVILPALGEAPPDA